MAHRDYNDDSGQHSCCLGMSCILLIAVVYGLIAAAGSGAWFLGLFQ